MSASDYREHHSYTGDHEASDTFPTPADAAAAAIAATIAACTPAELGARECTRWTHAARCRTGGMHAYCRRCLATYPGAHTAPSSAAAWRAEHVCEDLAGHSSSWTLAPASDVVFGCSPIGQHVHDTTCLIDPADGINRRRCAECHASLVLAELGWCHEITGLYRCGEITR